MSDVPPNLGSEELLRTVVSNAPVVLFAVDREGVFTLSDGAGLQALDLRPGEAVGQSVFAMFREVPQVEQHIRRALEGEDLFETVKVGELVYMTRYSPLRDAAGEVSGVIGVATDITERRRAEESLEQSEARFRTLYERTPVMLHSIDNEGRLVSVSDEWLRVMGYTREELLGRSSVEFLTAASRRYAKEQILPEFFRTGVCFNVPYQFVKKSGEVVEVLLSATAERDPEGQIVRSLAILIDVTERNRMQAQLVQADRLSSLGTLAAGVAHEINNPLSYVITNLTAVSGLLDRRPGDLDQEEHARLRELIADAREGAGRVRGIVGDLALFSRPDEEQIAPVDLNLVLDTILKLAGNEVRHVATVERDYGQVPPVRANEARLGQVLLNLVLNAAQAILAVTPADGGNTIRIRTRSREGEAVVEVHDTGPGIAPENLDRVFDPFFSTKPIGEGSGLGLSIAHGIVTRLGGKIRVTSSPEDGTRFTVSLPVSDQPIPSPGRVSPSPERPDVPHTRLLVVDDDPGVAKSLRLALSEMEVSVATGGREAVEACQADPYDVILCDVLMPDMMGMEVFDMVRQVRPGLEERIVFMTGGAFTPRAQKFLESVPNPVLQKPFDLEEALDLIARLAP